MIPWGVVVAICTIGGGLIVTTWKLARAAGNLEQQVAQLVERDDDHEERLRRLEDTTRWPRRRPGP